MFGDFISSYILCNHGVKLRNYIILADSILDKYTDRVLFDGFYPAVYISNRDSNQKEVDVLVKQEGEVTVARRAVVYNGDFENQAGDIALVNYRRLPQLLEV